MIIRHSWTWLENSESLLFKEIYKNNNETLTLKPATFGLANLVMAWLRTNFVVAGMEIAVALQQASEKSQSFDERPPRSLLRCTARWLEAFKGWTIIISDLEKQRPHLCMQLLVVATIFCCSYSMRIWFVEGRGGSTLLQAP